MNEDEIDMTWYHELIQKILYKMENDSRKVGNTKKDIFMQTLDMGFLLTHSVIFYLRTFSEKDKEFFMESISNLYDSLAPVIKEKKKQ